MEFNLNPCMFWPKDGDPREQIKGVVQQAEAGINRGYDGIWFPHFYLNDTYNRFQPIPVLSRLAGLNEDVNIGLIYLFSLTHPVAIAENISTLDYLTDGDVKVVALQGYAPVHFESFGIDKRARTTRFVEAIQLIRKLWTEDEVTFSGQHFSVNGVSSNPKAGYGKGIPIYIGANADSSVERAGRLGNGWLISQRTSLEEAELLRQSYDRGVDKSSFQDEGVYISRSVYVANSTEQAEREVRPMMRNRVQTYLRRGAHDIVAETGEIDDQVEKMMKERLVGSPGECIQRIEKMNDRLDIRGINCDYGWKGLSNPKMVRSIELFGDEVLPHFD